MYDDKLEEEGAMLAVELSSSMVDQLSAKQRPVRRRTLERVAISRAIFGLDIGGYIAVQFVLRTIYEGVEVKVWPDFDAQTCIGEIIVLRRNGKLLRGLVFVTGFARRWRQDTPDTDCGVEIRVCVRAKYGFIGSVWVDDLLRAEQGVAGSKQLQR